MPRTAIDYSKTLIYKLVHKDDLENENVYVGSTTDFRRRKSQHKSNCNNVDSDSHYFKVYQNIRENDGWDEWVMLEIEKFPCTDKREACARERYWCEYYRSKLNTQLPGRTHNQWYKEYYQTHKEEIKTQKKKYNEENPEKRKEYRQNNAENINRKRREKEQITCECGKIMKVYSLPKHKRNNCKSLQVA